MDHNLVEVQLTLEEGGTSKQFDAFLLEAQNMKDHPEDLVHVIHQRAERAGKTVKRLCYRDDENDWCTLSKDSVSDALQFARPAVSNSILEVKVVPVNEGTSKASPAATTASAAQPESTDSSSSSQEPAAPPSALPANLEQVALEALNGLAAGLDLRQLVPKLAEAALRVIEGSQETALFGLIDLLAAFRDGHIAADQVPQVLGEIAGTLQQISSPEVLRSIVETFKDQAVVAAAQLRKDAQEKKEVEVHPHVICDGCEMKPILGRRYKAKDRNFDLCGDCFDATERDGSKFKRIKSELRATVESSFFAAPVVPGQPEVHTRVQCDGCHAYPLVGRRFKCVDRPDFDLCGTCYQRAMQDSDLKDLHFEEIKLMTVQGEAKKAFEAAEAKAEEEPKEPEARPRVTFAWVSGEAAAASLGLKVSSQKYLMNKHTGKSLTDKTLSGDRFDVAMSTEPVTDTHYWEEEAAGDDYVRLRNVTTGKYLADVSHHEWAEGKCVMMFLGEVHDDQLWKKVPAEDGFFRLENKQTNLWLADVSHHLGSDKQLVTFRGEFYDDQLWKMVSHCDICGQKAAPQQLPAPHAIPEGAAKEALQILLSHPDPVVSAAAAEALDKVMNPPLSVEDFEMTQEETEPEEQPTSPMAIEEVKVEVKVEEPAVPEPEVPAHRAPSAHVLSSVPLTLGIEAQEEEEARQDVTVEYAALLAEVGARQAFRIGRVRLPVSNQPAAPIPVEAKVVVVNDGEVAWPEDACLVCVGGDSFNFPKLELGSLQPGEAAEIIMDLEISHKDTVGETNSWWALQHSRDSLLGPCLLLETRFTEQ